MKQPPFGGMMPMFMPMPFGFQQQGADNSERAYDMVVPARVNKAMEFLGHIHHKQATRAAVYDLGVEQIPGVELCAEEEATRDAALKCLSDYFDGKLKPDQWEGLKYDFQKKAAEKHLSAPHGGAQVMQGAVLSCPKCSEPGNRACKFCNGTAQVMVTPMPGSGGVPGGLSDILNSIFGGMPGAPPDAGGDEDDEDDSEPGQ